MILHDLRQTLEGLDDEIEQLRNTLNPPGSPLQSIDTSSQPNPTSSATKGGKGKYEMIDDKARLERLVRAKEKTKESLEGRAGWVGMDQARAEDRALEGAAAASTTAEAAPVP